MTDAATTGAQLWKDIVRHAGLQPGTRYDEAILDDVRRRLGLAPSARLPAALDAAGTSPTEVLVAVLGAVQPWAQMMQDLLRLLQACGATRSKTAVRAQVDLRRATEELDLDLRDFAEAVASYETVRRSVLRSTWSFRALFELQPLVGSVPDDVATPAGVAAWVDAYEGDRSQPVADVPWPDPPAEPPRSGHADLDRALDSAYRGWLGGLETLRGIAGTRRALYEVARRDDGPWDELREFCARDHDRWASVVLTGLHRLARHVADGGWAWPWWTEQRSPQELIDLVASLPATEVVEDYERPLEHLLSLPAWRKRYDVYSNWIFTQVAAALDECGLVVATHEGRIDFGFAHARMAAVPGTELAVHCELRSRLIGESTKRKEGVQPDYTVLIGDAGDPPQSSVLEVECKQYLQAGPKNFGTALQDYARSRPSAAVAVVNYGPVSPQTEASTFSYVEAALAPRCTVLGDVRPGQPGARALQQLVRDVVARRLPELFRPRIDVAVAATIELHWAANCADDLDCHLQVEDADGATTTIWHRNRGSDGHAPFAWLVRDIVEGPGPETIEVERWLGATYRLRVENYSGRALGPCAPTVVLRSASGHELRFACPDTAAAGTTWDVIGVDGATGEVTVLTG